MNLELLMKFSQQAEEAVGLLKAMLGHAPTIPPARPIAKPGRRSRSPKRPITSSPRRNSPGTGPPQCRPRVGVLPASRSPSPEMAGAHEAFMAQRAMRGAESINAAARHAARRVRHSVR